MDYLGQVFGIFKPVFNFCWNITEKIFNYVSPLGMTFIFGLIVCIIVYRYLVMPFLR